MNLRVILRIENAGSVTPAALRQDAGSSLFASVRWPHYGMHAHSAVSVESSSKPYYACTFIGATKTHDPLPPALPTPYERSPQRVSKCGPTSLRDFTPVRTMFVLMSFSIMANSFSTPAWPCTARA
jgi:hypothetical protein